MGLSGASQYTPVERFYVTESYIAWGAVVFACQALRGFCMLGLWVVHCPENQLWVEMSCCQGNRLGHSCVLSSGWQACMCCCSGEQMELCGLTVKSGDPFWRHFLTMLAHQGAAKSKSIVYVRFSVFRSHCLALSAPAVVLLGDRTINLK